MQGGLGLVADAPWPEANEAYLVEDSVTLPIQVNGKRRSEIVVAKDTDNAEVEKLVSCRSSCRQGAGRCPAEKN